MWFSNKYHVFRNQIVNSNNPVYAIYTVFYIFSKDSMIIMYLNPMKHLNSEISSKLKHSSVQKECYMGANENKTFSSYYIQENHLNIVLE